MRHTILGLAAVALLLGGVGQAQAGIIQLASPGDLNPGDTTAIYAGNDGDVVPSPLSLAAGGNTLTFTTMDGGNFQRVDEGTSWSGAFANGTKLLWTLDPLSNPQMGSPVTIGFASSVTEVGLSVQQDNPVSTTFMATAFGTMGQLSITVVVPDSGTGPGNLGFIGFAGTGGELITSISISSMDPTNGAFNNDFAMGPVTFGSAQVVIPEPSSLVLAGFSTVGLLAYGIFRRKPRVA